MEALEIVPYLCQSNITVLCFDFPGCGLSEGEFISLGWHERDDLDVIVEYMRVNRNVSTVGLWGRSMGAVTCLLHGDRDPGIAGMVLDSPFSNLRKLVDELAKKYTKVPNFLLSAAVWAVKKSIKSRADFDIEKLSPIDHVQKCFIPAMFGAGIQDDFIDPQHAQDLYEKYAGDKNIV
jgi:alpha-beta hydrolase superfamily lysophospholipase